MTRLDACGGFRATGIVPAIEYGSRGRDSGVATCSASAASLCDDWVALPLATSTTSTRRSLDGAAKTHAGHDTD